MVERGVISADEGGVIDLPHLLRKEQLGDTALLSVSASGGLAANAGTGVGAAGLPASPATLFEQLDPHEQGMVDLGGVEQRLVREAVERAKGNLSAAARVLNLTRAPLAYRLRSSAVSSPAG